MIVFFDVLWVCRVCMVITFCLCSPFVGRCIVAFKLCFPFYFVFFEFHGELHIVCLSNLYFVSWLSVFALRVQSCCRWRPLLFIVGVYLGLAPYLSGPFFCCIFYFWR